MAVNDEFIAGFVRLSFHDCVSQCDGAINIDNSDNAGMVCDPQNFSMVMVTDIAMMCNFSIMIAGLNRYIRELETAFTDNDVYDIMSRADFWALCGAEAVLKAWELSSVCHVITY